MTENLVPEIAHEMLSIILMEVHIVTFSIRRMLAFIILFHFFENIRVAAMHTKHSHLC